ncbi:MAG TPA: hypothetical protein VMY18_00595 [Acidobacteriota bacterium]|nr:hypothetical protein [Acidobacteriota bacterium]
MVTKCQRIVDDLEELGSASCLQVSVRQAAGETEGRTWRSPGTTRPGPEILVITTQLYDIL